MALDYLDFEEPIVDLETKIDELRELSKRDGIDFSSEIKKLSGKVNRLRKDTFSRLSPWQRTRLARHPKRPYALDYISNISSGFLELHGDRTFADGVSIVGGFCKLDGRTVMIIGQQKGRDTKEKIYRNFGMSHPEGYRKALRLMKLAEKFNRPIVTLVDTPGAYPGVGAEERGQSEAIARNLIEMSALKVAVVCVVIGEGGSGGAIALGVGNKVLMMENSVYSVISPEGCAAILWKSSEKVEEAAEALRLTAQDLLQFGLIDEIVKEPLGGAHRNPRVSGSILRRALRRNLNELCQMSPEELQKQRREKFRNMGSFV
ncbi:Acetyl-coenzyme A carboxyl transferase alpha chain [hydrothermal vent metagenome]|uniref:acetyl-CoA carboxytransferase n=1 Tax=hydrothermal vent metagenome TaxID=652676 RepID=A0A3B1BKH1_9ZZZZ